MNAHLNNYFGSITWIVLPFLLLSFVGSVSNYRTNMFSNSKDLNHSCKTIDFNLMDVDGTQLVQETKEFLAERHHVQVSEVTAVYCCQLPDGRFKYNCTFPVDENWYVLWTVSGGQIIGGDEGEGF